jgi:hypothetical protein
MLLWDMPGDSKKPMHTARQAEINRQHMISISKRLTELELKFHELEIEVEDVKFLNKESLETVERLQVMISKILSNQAKD